jgi:trehalose synthase
VREVTVVPALPERLSRVLLPERAEEFLALARLAKVLLAGRTIWNISSTAGGGGVAEMLGRFVRYVRGAGVDCRWLVLEGSAEFFAVTKRLHNNLHDDAGDNGPLGDDERAAYQAVADTNADALVALVDDGDVVILHDPQAVGLAPRVRERGIPVVWRCHVGVDQQTEVTDRAWTFLRPWVEQAHIAVFSRAAYAPGWLDREHLSVIAPAIDPLSPKNQPLDDEAVVANLACAGVLDGDGARAGFLDANDEWRSLDCRVDLVRENGPLAPDVRLLVQVSRWDRLKDMGGVMRGFVDADVHDATGAHLLLVGPEVSGVTDDPEGKAVLDECVAAWKDLPASDRSTVSLVTVPMTDLDQNAAVVNALQRHATVVTQKSRKEGFGLTVSEAMWKGRAVVASAVGGILDQVRDGEDGVLLEDPTDLAAFGTAVRRLLEDDEQARRMGKAAHERVRDNFLADRDLGQWMQLLELLGVN